MIRFLIRWLYLVAVGGSMAALYVGALLGWSLEVVLLGSSVTTLLAGVILERKAPFNPDWRSDAQDSSADVTSAVVLIGLVDPLIKALLPVVALSLLTDGGHQDWLLGAMPFALQVFIAILWIEFGLYWSHRAHHRFASLWWLHALHHSSERLYWLNNFRFHPLNHLINSLASMMPLLLLGAPKEVLLGAASVTQTVTLLQHANIGARNGWLNYIFSTNEIHRWHHSATPHEAHSNYGSALVLWDQLFGTFRVEKENRPTNIGLFGDGAGYPASAPYHRQLLSMFTPACCRA